MHVTFRLLAGIIATLLLISLLQACHSSVASSARTNPPQAAEPQTTDGELPQLPDRTGLRILFICDASWTMTDLIDDSLLHLAAQIDKLDPIDTFTIIVPRERSTLIFSRDLRDATDANRRAATEFISTITPKNQNDFAEALKLIDAVRPNLIHLLSDGDFDSDKFLEGLAQLNRDKQTRINTTLFALTDQKIEGNQRTQVMKKIAADHGGEFSVIRCDRPDAAQ